MPIDLGHFAKVLRKQQRLQYRSDDFSARNWNRYIDCARHSTSLHRLRTAQNVLVLAEQEISESLRFYVQIIFVDEWWHYKWVVSRSQSDRKLSLSAVFIHIYCDVCVGHTKSVYCNNHRRIPNFKVHREDRLDQTSKPFAKTLWASASFRQKYVLFYIV